MSGTFVSDRLAEGQVAGAGDHTVYTCPASTVAYIHCANFVNVSAGSVTVRVILSASGSRELGSAQLTDNHWRYEFIDERPIHLSAGDVLVLNCSAGNNIDYAITGVEET
jgi:hypothetical protein